MIKNDTNGSVNELDEALKPVIEIIKLSNEMKNLIAIKKLFKTN